MTTSKGLFIAEEEGGEEERGTVSFGSEDCDDARGLEVDVGEEERDLSLDASLSVLVEMVALFACSREVASGRDFGVTENQESSSLTTGEGVEASLVLVGVEEEAEEEDGEEETKSI